MEEQAANLEKKMTDALATQAARLIAKIGKGKKPIKIEEEEPSHGEVHDETPEAKKMRERIESLEKSLAAIKTKDGIDLDSLSLFPKAKLPPKF